MNLSIEPLRAVVAQLAGRDAEFANSLLIQHDRRGLSEKQWHWVGKLIERASEPRERQTTEIGSVKGIVELLERALKHLKRPAIIVRANGRDIRLNLAGAKAKVPGSINVCSTGGFDDRNWFGRITCDGQFEPSRKFDEATQTAIAQALHAMANDPAKAASEYGQLTGVCCFCSLPLTDARSTQVGYGKICARHYGLPWGARQ